MNHIEVQIMQQGYRLACPEGQQETLLQAVERVDAAMTRIRDAGKVRARERIAVLAALNLAFELADHQARSAQQPQPQPQQHPDDPQPHPGNEDSPPQADGSVESLQDGAPQAAASAAAPPAPQAAAEAAAPPERPSDAAIGAAGDEALEALLRRLDQALGQEGRPA
jgi:cell division protein ZapA